MEGRSRMTSCSESTTKYQTPAFPHTIGMSSFSQWCLKTGDPTDANNWRPIAILDVVYKVFAKILYNPLFPTLDPQQSDEQFGFRTDCGTDEALMILACII